MKGLRGRERLEQARNPKQEDAKSLSQRQNGGSRGDSGRCARRAGWSRNRRRDGKHRGEERFEALRLAPGRGTQRGEAGAKAGESGRAGSGSLGSGRGGPYHSPACLARRRDSCGRSGLRGADGSLEQVGHQAWSGVRPAAGCWRGWGAGARGAGRRQRREMLDSAPLGSARAALGSAGFGAAARSARSPPLPLPPVGHARFNPAAAAAWESQPAIPRWRAGEGSAG